MRSALGRSPLAGDRRDGLGLLRRPQAGSYRSRRGNVISADSTKLIERKTCRPKPMRSALGRSPLAGDRRDGLGLSVARKRAPTGPSAAMSSLPTAPSSSSERRADQNPCARPWVGARLRATVAMASGFSVARKRAPTGPGAAMSSLPTAPSSSSERRADQNPCARPWVGARLRATVAMASGSPSPASGLLPDPARQCHLCRRPQAHRSKDVHTNPCARPWVGARLRATVAMASDSPSPASGLLPVPARQCHLCQQPQAHRSKDVHTNPCARPWVGARLRATVAMASGFSVRPQAGSYRTRRGNVISADSPKLIERKTCRPKPMRSALGRSPLAGDRRDGLGLLRRPQAGSYRSRRGNVISADSTKLIERKTCRPKPMRSALGRSPLAGDRRDGLGPSVARKRAPTGPGAAMSSLPTATSSSIERRAHQPMRSALGRSPLAGDRRDGLGLSVARKRAPTGPGAAMSSLPTATSSSIERRAHQPMRSALGRSPLAGDRRDGLGLSVARKRAPTGPSAAMSSLPTAPSSSSERRADQNPCARPWVGARLRATVAMTSGFSVARKRAPTGPGAAMSSLPTAPSSSSERRADQNPCARPWVGARLRATVAMASGSPSPASGLPTGPGAAMSSLPTAPSSSSERRANQTHALGPG
jgi:hypothetical protein